jgi:mono/diheme cytochrome c family protein
MKKLPLLASLFTAGFVSFAMPSYADQPIYQVSEGHKLDSETYNGFKLYRNWCARCHGTYGQGMVGPNLANSLKVLSKDEFFAVVENGKSGAIGSMPAWKSNAKVMEDRDNIYSYLKARSDGAIGEVKPKKIK